MVHTHKVYEGVYQMRDQSSLHLRLTVSSSHPQMQTILLVPCEISQEYSRHVHTHACARRTLLWTLSCTLLFESNHVYWRTSHVNIYRSTLYLLWLDSISLSGWYHIWFNYTLLMAILVVSSLLPLLIMLSHIRHTSLYAYS